MGDRYLRKLLVSGRLLRCVPLQAPRRRFAPLGRSVARAQATRRGGFKLVAVALANKIARIIFAVLTSGQAYEPHAIAG